MINIRPILFVLGLLLIVLGLTMFVPIIIEITNNFKESQKFIYSSGITIFFGLLLFTTNYKQEITNQLVMHILSYVLLLPIFILFFIGGTSGSTTGALKIIRTILVFKYLILLNIFLK